MKYAMLEQHIHGAFGIDFNSATVEEMLFVANQLYKRGIVAFFPTLVTDSVSNINRQISIIKSAAQKCHRILGIHLEGIFINPEKNYTFSLEDRVKMLILATDELENVMVSYSTGLVIDYMREHEIEKIIKGYRNDIDLEYEKKQAEWNKKMGGYETELWLSNESFLGISSTLAREKLAKGEDISDILPQKVISFLLNH